MIKEQSFIVVEFCDLPDDIKNTIIEYYGHVSNECYKRYWLTKGEPLYKLIVDSGFENPDCVLINFDW